MSVLWAPVSQIISIGQDHIHSIYALKGYIHCNKCQAMSHCLKSGDNRFIKITQGILSGMDGILPSVLRRQCESWSVLILHGLANLVKEAQLG